MFTFKQIAVPSCGLFMALTTLMIGNPSTHEAGGGGGDPSSDPVVPPPGLNLSENAGFIEKGYQGGMISWDNSSKALRIHWFASAEPVTYNSSVAEPIVDYQQQIELPGIFLTEVIKVDNATLLIAGVSSWESGSSLIVYEQPLVWPSPMPAPITDPASGESRVEVAIPAFGRKRVVYSSTMQPGRFGVRHLWNLRSPDDQSVSGYLVQFHDSGDIYTIDASSLAMSLAVTPAGAPVGVLEAPGIDFYHHRSAAYFSSELGMVYAGESSGSLTTMVLIDGDLDGSLDHAELMSSADWEALAGPNGSNWEWFGH